MKWKTMFQESDQYAVKADRGWKWLDLPYVTKSAFHSCFLWNVGWTVIIQITEVIPYVTDS